MGCIYILTNKSFNNQIKIGYTGDLDNLLEQLNNSMSTPNPFEVYGIYIRDKFISDEEIKACLDIGSEYVGSGFYNLQPEAVYRKLNKMAVLSDTLNNLQRGTVLSENANLYHTVRNGIKAFAKYLGGGKMIVLANSQVDLLNWSFGNGKGKNIKKIRKKLQRSSNFEKRGELYYVNVDVEFKSPSAASSFIFGCASNGWTEWVDDEGRTLDAAERSNCIG